MSKIKDPGDTFRIFFISLGCDKNTVDSEQMIGLLTKKGYVMCDDADDADACVINTCCFIGDAKEESINTIIEMGERKKTGELKAIIVCGCLAQRYPDDIMKLLPEVDAIVGTTAIDSIVSALDEALLGHKSVNLCDRDRSIYLSGIRRMTLDPHTAYLKIADGCDKNCTYCIIPKIRGRYRSVPMEDLVNEASYLAEMGAKELILIAQETTLYGVDLYGRKSLHVLLEKLCRIEGIEWIRIMYCYPEEIYDELIYCMRDEAKICHYLDLPIQHCSDRILSLMGRKTTKEKLTEMITRLRREIPDIALRTTLISGFPTESEEEHRELIDFVKETGFERLGDFAYSKEEDTAAGRMAGQIHPGTRKRRRREIMEAQQEVAFAKAESAVGRILDVMIEGRIPEDNVYAGRTYMDAPEVDGYIFIDSERGDLMSGDIVKAEVTGARGYDLLGRLV